MRLKKSFVILSCILLEVCLLGCTTDEANRVYTDVKLPVKDISEVEILNEAPQRPYIVIADFQACKVSVKHMRKRAAEVGADAVIIIPAGGFYSQNEVWASSDSNSKSYSRLIATAIIYEK